MVRRKSSSQGNERGDRRESITGRDRSIDELLGAIKKRITRNENGKLIFCHPEGEVHGDGSPLLLNSASGRKKGAKRRKLMEKKKWGAKSSMQEENLQRRIKVKALGKKLEGEKIGKGKVVGKKGCCAQSAGKKGMAKRERV